MQRLFREARMGMIGGTSEILRNVIAKRMESRFPTRRPRGREPRRT